MSDPGLAGCTQGSGAALDDVLQAIYGINFGATRPHPAEPYALDISAPSEPHQTDATGRAHSQTRSITALSILTAALLMAALALYWHSTETLTLITLALWMLALIVDAGLYLLGFLSAYAYQNRKLAVPLVEIDWWELIPGVVFFAMARLSVWWLHLTYPGFSAMTILWTCGFITSPGLSEVRKNAMFGLLGKLLKTFTFKKEA